MVRYHLIVACDKKRGIGLDNSIPWRLKKDMLHFKNITTNQKNYDTEGIYHYTNAVVMGRKTWQSLPEKFRPLPNRFNVVLTRGNPEEYLKDIPEESRDWVSFVKSFDEIEQAITEFNQKHLKATQSEDDSQSIYRIDQTFIIGGADIYKQALAKYQTDRIYLTEVYRDFKCDVTFPKFEVYGDRHVNYPAKARERLGKILETDGTSEEKDKEKENQFALIKASDIEEENGLHYRFFEYQSCRFLQPNTSLYFNHTEEEYLNVMLKIIDQGDYHMDRTEVGTYALFGERLVFDLKKGFPISTTKRMFFRGVFEELMLYLRGQTDTKILAEKGVNIWDKNTTREFLDSRGLSHYPVGDMGETYGFNIRHFGGQYKDCHTQYSQGHGYDQLANLINLLENNPTSRRMILSLWNPATCHKGTLPSCLFLYQFFVNMEKKELNCQINLRSSDYFLANNWNTCTGGLLVHLLCSLKQLDLKPGKLIVVSGDTHIYHSHLEAVRTNLERKPFPYPKLIVKEKKDNIEDFEYTDLELIGYHCHKRIPAEMAV